MKRNKLKSHFSLYVILLLGIAPPNVVKFY
jgi:hypothetical protein